MDKTILDKILIPDVLGPFFATIAGASTVIVIEAISKFFRDKKKKLYAINTIVYTYTKILHMQLILKKMTIQPHIDGVKRMIAGDKHLLAKTFLADEFDVLTDDTMNFDLLSNEYKILIAQDKLDYVQIYEMICKLLVSRKATDTLNLFVRDNLKIEAKFGAKSPEEQESILYAYLDHMEKIKHDADRCISFVLDHGLPSMKKYKNSRQFYYFPKKNINENIKRFYEIKENFREILPEENYVFKSTTDAMNHL